LWKDLKNNGLWIWPTTDKRGNNGRRKGGKMEGDILTLPILELTG